MTKKCSGSVPMERRSPDRREGDSPQHVSGTGNLDVLQVDLTEPVLSTVQRAGMTPAVLIRMVQFQDVPDGTDRLARPLFPISSSAAFWAVSRRWTVAGPAMDPEAVVVPPDTSQDVLVGTTPSMEYCSITGIE